VGTVVGDRVVYRATDNITVAAPFVPHPGAGPARADRPRAALRGAEPFQEPTPGMTKVVAVRSRSARG
jgi:hypothetical protein